MSGPKAGLRDERSPDGVAAEDLDERIVERQREVVTGCRDVGSLNV
jgi:hypothetical protein